MLGQRAVLADTSVALPDSVCPVDASAPATGSPSRHGGYITRRSLTADEVSAPITFEVALKLNNFADLQARVARGERISAQEMAARYEPSAAAYAQVVDWLTAQGFTLGSQPNTHLAVFAQGTVSQVQTALGVTLARVSDGTTEFTSAITAPSVPGSIAPLLVGFNGLQPHLHAHTHLLMKTSSLTGTSPPYTPQQIAQAYDATPLYNAGVTGSGQTIAIVISTFPNTSDLTSFWTTYGINQSLNNITFIQAVSGRLSAPSGEETLDTEWSSSLAPGCKVRVYATRNLQLANFDTAYLRIYDDATANPSLNITGLSMSYGLGETYNSASQVMTDDQDFALLAGIGVSLFAASGDGGATPGSSGHTGTGSLQVETPASDPNVTGVGGTSLTLTSTGSPNTEVVWNDPSGNGAGASGGGYSEYFGQPPWQTGQGVPSSSGRCVPDVASSADLNNGAAGIFDGSEVEFGGTSWSAPSWAAFGALINQSRANAGLKPVGDLAPQLYALIGSSSFRDITSGNNEFQSTQGYSAGTGYDLCTGIGVPDVANLAFSLTTTNSTGADTPTLPPWGIAVLAAALTLTVVLPSARTAR